MYGTPLLLSYLYVVDSLGAHNFAFFCCFQLGASQNSEDVAATATDLDGGVGADVSASLAITSDSQSAVVMASGSNGGEIAESAAEALQVVNPDEACSQMLQPNNVGEQAVVPVQVGFFFFWRGKGEVILCRLLGVI